MAQRQVTILTDDLDGKEGTDIETVSLAVNGTTYEIDLSKKNREALTKALAPYTDAGRKVGRGSKRSSATGPAITAEDRDWLRKNGFPDLGERGRISNVAKEALAKR
jgi:hypothetical protein